VVPSAVEDDQISLGGTATKASIDLSSFVDSSSKADAALSKGEESSSKTLNEPELTTQNEDAESKK